jgi:hypothetical protein
MLITQSRAFAGPARSLTQDFKPPQPPENNDPIDWAVVGGQAAGATLLGGGLGYLGLTAGVQLGLESGMRAMGGHPGMQILGLLTVGVARAVVAGAIGAGLGVAAGAGIGGYLGGKVAERLA